MSIFLRLSAKGRLDSGEYSTVAVAIDDSHAIRRAAGIAGNRLTVFRTQEVIVHLTEAKLFKIVDAIREN
ncbi:MAG: hypothetical protein OXD42_05800 [Rhodospirillaceae bacterium]|nr:hypothetical protein [Rhodospirillaceae bacterium]